MKTRLLLLSCAIAFLGVPPAHAQLAAPGEGGVAMGHVHLTAKDVEASRRFFTEMQAWYAKHFGAVPGKRGQNAAGDLPGVNLTFGKVDTVNPGTRGRALDHIGFEIRNLPQFIAKLEAAGVKLDSPLRKAGNGTTSIAFLTDPWGTYIELTEGLAPAH